jgi:hypothetical protein
MIIYCIPTGTPKKKILTASELSGFSKKQKVNIMIYKRTALQFLMGKSYYH